ncbi:UNVERIFIED_CONTAM: hypothetical protein RMT77_013839 [Armadillidium vulgare]
MKEMTMTPDNDVNAIFEKHSVKEIEDILKKMRSDIERKKEDLRIMVGERYRDLIEAADTITEMRNSAEAVCKNIERMEGLCESLQQRGLIGFKTKMSTSVDNSSRMLGSTHQYSIAVQVKLLVDVPEILWELTEKREYLDAAKLLLLAQQTHTALQLSPNANDILEKFPVISRQWSNISQFRSTITKGCTFLIKNEVENYEQVVNAVAAMTFIEGCDMKTSLKQVLDLRKSSLLSTLTVKSSSVSKAHIIEFVVRFISSFSIVYNTFLGFEKSGDMVSHLERKIYEVSGENGYKGLNIESKGLPISLLQESSLALSFLPKSVVDYRPKLRCKIETLSTDQIQNELQQWLKNVLIESSNAISELLSCITSIKALSLIRSAIWELQKNKIEEEHWNKMISILLGQASFSPWCAVVREESKKQAQNIIKKELNLVAESVRQMVQNFIVDIKENSKICMEEGDISDFLWSESMSDLPDQNMWLTLNSKNSFEAPEKIGLFYKSRGYTTRIQNLCKALNCKLTLLLEDISKYSPLNAVEDFGKVSSSQSEKEDALQDYILLLEFLEKETLIVFKRFVDEVCKIAMSQFSSLEENLDILCEESVNSVLTPKTTVIVIISRLCQAVPIVCHQLKTCANASLLGSQETARRVGLGLQSDTNTWTELNNFFLEKCTFLMTKYLSITSRIFGKKLRCEINKSVESASPENLLLLFPTWDEVKIEEENEGGRIVESTVSVPGSPSPSLLKALMGVCTSVNSVCAHTIPRTSQMQLVSSLCSEIKCSYDGLSDNVNQSTALQLIFDLKLIQNILLPRESKEINTKISSLIQDFESRIDPFDLDVLSPHISSKVKMASQKVLALMGTIIPREKQPLTMKGSSASSNNNMLPIVPSVEIPRFSNVPLPPSASSRKTSIMNTIALEKQLKNPLELSSSASSRDTITSVTSSKSTASSIFSAMSSSWFGS